MLLGIYYISLLCLQSLDLVVRNVLGNFSVLVVLGFYLQRDRPCISSETGCAPQSWTFQPAAPGYVWLTAPADNRTLFVS